jgi:hypothetical protein
MRGCFMVFFITFAMIVLIGGIAMAAAIRMHHS